MAAGKDTKEAFIKISHDEIGQSSTYGAKHKVSKTEKNTKSDSTSPDWLAAW